MEQFQVAAVIDLKQFIDALNKIKGTSEDAAAYMQNVFDSVKPIEQPINSEKIEVSFDQASAGATTLNDVLSGLTGSFDKINIGSIATSNNIGTLTSDILSAKNQTGNWKDALTQVGSGLIGFGGLSFAVSLVTIAIKDYIFTAAKSESEQSKMRKTVSELAEEYKTLNDRLNDVKRDIESLDFYKLESALRGLKKEAEALNTEFENAIKTAVTLQSSPFGGIIAKMLGATPEDIAALSMNKAQVEEALKKITNLGNNLNKIQSAFNKGVFSSAIKEFTKNELTDMQKKLTDIADSTLPAVSRQIDFNGVSFKITGAEARKLAEEIGNIYKKQKETQEKELIETDKQIRAKITLIDQKIKEAKSENELIKLLELRVAEVKKLYYVSESIFKLVEQIKKSKPDIGKSESYLFDQEGKLREPFEMQPVPETELAPAVKETTAELENMLWLANSMTDAFNNAAKAIASAGSSSINVFSHANSLLQIFINSLIQAAVQALILKGIMFIGSLFTGGASSVVSTAAGSFANGGLFSGAPGIDRNTIRISDGEYIVNAVSTKKFLPLLNTINSLPKFNTGGASLGSGNQIASLPVQTIVLDTQLRGRDIYLVSRREDQHTRTYK